MGIFGTVGVLALWGVAGAGFFKYQWGTWESFMDVIQEYDLNQLAVIIAPGLFGNPEDPSVRQMKQELKGRGANIGGVEARFVGKSSSQRGLFATKHILEMETIVFLPSALFITPEHCLTKKMEKPFNEAIGAAIQFWQLESKEELELYAHFSLLSLCVVRAQADGAPPYMASYARTFPDKVPRLFNTYTYPQRMAIQALTGGHVMEGVGDKFYNITNSILDTFLEDERTAPAFQADSNYTDVPGKEVWAKALALVVSRVMAGPDKKRTLVPLVDLMNFAGRSQKSWNAEFQCFDGSKPEGANPAAGGLGGMWQPQVQSERRMEGNPGCKLIAKRHIKPGEQIRGFSGAEGDTNLLALYGFSLNEPISSFRVFPTLEAHDKVEGYCKQIYEWGFALNETTGGVPSPDVMFCVGIGLMPYDMLQRAAKDGYFQRGTPKIPFHMVQGGKPKWRTLERNALRDARKQCQDQLMRLEAFVATGLDQQLGDDAVGRIVSTQLQRDVRLVRGCIRGFNETLYGGAEGKAENDEE